MVVISVVLLALMTIGCSSEKSNPQPLRETIKGTEIHDLTTQTGNWYTQDSSLDLAEGVSSAKAALQLSLKNEKEIIVAVLDTGVDIQHPDLKGQIWTNTGETGLDSLGHDRSTNQVDDDQNGYVDDVYGWNFLGSAAGEHVVYETSEVTREVVRLEKRLVQGEVLNDLEEKYYKKIRSEHSTQVTTTQRELKALEAREEKVREAKSILKTKLNLQTLTEDVLKALDSTDADVIRARRDLLDIFAQFKSLERFGRVVDTLRDSLKYYLNKKYNARLIVGDDPNNFEQTQYGNNDVVGPMALHGTHVAGLIAALQNNGLGADGVAKNVKIMVLKIVPNGDERDKDVALAVRYAVRNGAHIINMSFGKSLSPQKAQVDAAMLEASEKGILLFHAAGNSARDNDIYPTYPNRYLTGATVRTGPAEIPTWMEIGASGKTKGPLLIARFSNYGKKDVDLFSPGEEVLSTIPGGRYMAMSGTSMASPVAAGVAALILSNAPHLTGVETKEIMLQNVQTYPDLKVRKPGAFFVNDPLPFSDFSRTGGIINSYLALESILR